MFFPTLLDLHEKVRSVVPLSILFLEYSRAPAAKYPVQLEEAVSAYRYLIESLKVDSSDIILGGDSAGGHLALQLLQHIQTPHPFSRRVPDARPLPRPSKCIFISPWLALKQTAPSFVSNELYDAIPSSLLRRWAAQWADNHEDQWTNPLDFDTDWGDIVPPSLVISGQQELLIDDIKKFCSQLKQSGCLLVEDHRHGKSHDWWWADYVMYGLFDYTRGFACNETIKAFIVGNM